MTCFLLASFPAPHRFQLHEAEVLRVTENSTGLGMRLVSFTMYSTAHICTKPQTYIPQLPNKVVSTSWEVGGINGDEVVWRPALLPLAGSQQEDLRMDAEWQWRTERVLSPTSLPPLYTPKPLPPTESIVYISMTLLQDHSHFKSWLIITPWQYPAPLPLVWRAGYSKATPTCRVNCW